MFDETDLDTATSTVLPAADSADEVADTDAADLLEIAVPATVIDRDRLLSLRETLARHRGATPVRLVVEVPAIGRVVIDISKDYSVRPNRELRQQLDLLFSETRAA
jgi:hypothetical protein